MRLTHCQINSLQKPTKVGFLIFIAFFIFALFYSQVKASIVDDLKKLIQDKTEEIKKLEQESAKYKENLDKTKEVKNTLKNQINSLTDEIDNLNLNVKKTQAQISETDLTIDLLEQDIATKGNELTEAKKQMGQVLRLIYEFDKTNLLSIVLSSKTFSQALNQQEYLNNLQNDITLYFEKVNNLRSGLEKSKKDQENRKVSLREFKDRLDDQKEIVSIQANKKNELLRETKNQEAEYQKILSDLNKQRKSIEAEIGKLEEDLQRAIDKSKLPVGKGILAYPVDNIRKTQDYGMTSYAKSGAYNGSIHNGVDFGGPIGTSIKAASEGEVVGVGDNGRYAYGKWIAIKHTNGLVTLYGHLSLQKVKKGQAVKSGELIGYLGATGYVTGPHLHFTVYAPDSFTLYQSTKVSWLWIPIGAPLNPFDYL